MEDLIMKKIIMFVMVLMLCLGFAGEVEGAPAPEPEPACVTICPTDAGPNDEITLSVYDEEGEFFDLSEITGGVEIEFYDPEGYFYIEPGDDEMVDGSVVIVLGGGLYDAVYCWMYVDGVWFTLGVEKDGPLIFENFSDAVEAGGTCPEEIPVCRPKPSFVVIDPNVMLVYEEGETEGDFGVSLVNEPEPGETVTITVDPNNGGPSEDITLIGGDPCDGSITLTFNDGNWDEPQTVVFKAIDDGIPDEPELLEKQKILLSSVYSGPIQDPNWAGEEDVTVDVYDNDQPNILFTVTPADSTTPETPILPFPETTVQLWEESGWRNIGVTLQMPPSGDPVKLQVVVEGDNLPLTDPVLDPEGPDPNGLYFTAGNYDVSQTIKIWGNDDDELQAIDAFAEGHQDYQAVLVVTVVDDGGDEGYADLEQSVEFDIEDNECGAYGISYLDIANSSGEEEPDCYVDIYDVIEFATKWLNCSDPQKPGCESYL
jgi:hypothetical protein